MKYKVLLGVTTQHASITECMAQFNNIEGARMLLKAFEKDAHEIGEDALFWNIVEHVQVSITIEEITGEA